MPLRYVSIHVILMNIYWVNNVLKNVIPEWSMDKYVLKAVLAIMKH